MKHALPPQDAAFEKRLADALRAAAPADASAPGAADTVARCRAAMRPRRFPALRLAAAAAVFALLAGLAWWRVAGNGNPSAPVPVVAEAPAEAAPTPDADAATDDDTSLAALREAPLADDFEQMESFLVELASIQLSYEWSFDDDETLN